jgi:hypothetical protein
VLGSAQALGSQRVARDAIATQLVVEITRGHADAAEERAG